MEIKEFESHLKKGLGRAVINLRETEDKSPFLNAIWENAVAESRYDHQCEESRGHYIKTILECYPNTEELFSKIFSAYCDEKVSYEDREYHISNLLSWISEGVLGAKETLEKIYNILFNMLLNQLDKPDDTWACDRDRDNYTNLAYSLYNLDNSILDRLISDAVTLVKGSTRYSMTEFFDFFKCMLAVSQADEFKNTINSIKNNDPEFRSLYKSYVEKIRYSNPTDTDSSKPKNWRESIYLNQPCPIKSLWQNLSKEDEEEIALLMEKETDAQHRFNLLFCLNRFCSEFLLRYPRDPSPLIAELMSHAETSLFPYSGGSRNIFTLAKAVSCIRHPAVRDYALKMAPHYTDNPNSIIYTSAVNAWLTNFLPEDEDALMNFIISARDVSDLHFMDNNIIKLNPSLPDSFITYMYENTPCSTCRYNYFEYLMDRYSNAETLPEKIEFILAEAQFDCKQATRELAISLQNKRRI